MNLLGHRISHSAAASPSLEPLRDDCCNTELERSAHVHFAPCTSCRAYMTNNYGPDDFYSEEECEDMRRARRRDAKKAYIYWKFRHAPVQDCVFAGIENSLTPKLAEKARMSRVGYIRAVLEEQEWQRTTHEADPERLASVAREKSSWAVRRAVTIGCSQSKV